MGSSGETEIEAQIFKVMSLFLNQIIKLNTTQLYMVVPRCVCGGVDNSPFSGEVVKYNINCSVPITYV